MADSLKGWLILLVILGHAIQSTLGIDCESDHLWNLIYSFHMPAFMAVSGWLAYSDTKSSKTTWEWVNACKRRFFQLFVPFLVWASLPSILLVSFSFLSFCEKILYPDRSFWFLWVLFWICVLFYLTQLISSKLRVNETVIIGGTCILLVGIMVVLDIRVLGFQFLAYYYMFYSLGYILHKYGDTVFLKKMNSPYNVTVLIIIWGFLAWGWTMHGLPSWMPAISHVPSALLQYAYRGFTALVAIVVLIGVAPKMLNGTDKVNQIISSLGVVSLGLYVVHLSLIGHIVKGVLIIMPNISEWLCVANAFVLASVISYIVVWLLNKNKHTARIFLGKI